MSKAALLSVIGMRMQPEYLFPYHHWNNIHNEGGVWQTTGGLIGDQNAELRVVYDFNPTFRLMDRVHAVDDVPAVLNVSPNTWVAPNEPFAFLGRLGGDNQVSIPANHYWTFAAYATEPGFYEAIKVTIFVRVNAAWLPLHQFYFSGIAV